MKASLPKPPAVILGLLIVAALGLGTIARAQLPESRLPAHRPPAQAVPAAGVWPTTQRGVASSTAARGAGQGGAGQSRPAVASRPQAGHPTRPTATHGHRGVTGPRLAQTPITLAQASPRAEQAPLATPAAAPVSSSLPASAPAAASPDGSAVDTRGSDLVAQAVERLSAHTSVSAKLREEIDLYGQRLLATGSYLQGPGPQHPFRLEIVAKSGERQSVVEHVCDGRWLWMFRRVNGKQSLTKVDLSSVGPALVATAPTQPPALVNFALGGLPKMLANLNAAFVFAAPQQSMMRGVPVWVLEGKWRPSALATLLPDKKEEILKGSTPDFAKVADQLPESVTLTLAQSTLFPHRIEYRRRKEHAGSLQPRRFGKSIAAETMVAIELFDLALDSTIDSRQFVWSAGNLEAVDGSWEYAGSLRTTRQPAP